MIHLKDMHMIQIMITKISNNNLVLWINLTEIYSKLATLGIIGREGIVLPLSSSISFPLSSALSLLNFEDSSSMWGYLLMVRSILQ